LEFLSIELEDQQFDTPVKSALLQITP
jgi:hypothetical protein